jgi:hypothetical protein
MESILIKDKSRKRKDVITPSTPDVSIIIYEPGKRDLTSDKAF